jgi:hypothetical protein
MAGTKPGHDEKRTAFVPTSPNTLDAFSLKI